MLLSKSLIYYNIHKSCCRPCIFARCIRTRWRDLFWFYLMKNMIFFIRDLESPLIFVLFLKGKQNKKENLSVTPYLENVVCEKLNLGSRVRLLIGKVQ